MRCLPMSWYEVINFLCMYDSQGKQWLSINLCVDHEGDYLWSSCDDVDMEANTYVSLK